MITVIIPKYPRKVRLSEKQKPRYYKWNGTDFVCGGKPAPQRYRDGFCTVVVYSKGKEIGVCLWYPDIYGFESIFPRHTNPDDTLYLADHQWKRIIANPKTVGTPKMQRINFQDLYSGNLHEHSRAKMVILIKEYMKPFIAHVPVISKYPVRINLEITDTIKNSYDNSKDDYGRAWDIDNRAIVYFKCFLDLLVSEGKLVSDDRLYVTEAGGAIFTPLPTNDDTNRELVFTIQPDERPEILNNQFYQQYEYFKCPESRSTRGDSEPW